jgi:hypothetical protein
MMPGMGIACRRARDPGLPALSVLPVVLLLALSTSACNHESEAVSKSRGSTASATPRSTGAVVPVNRTGIPESPWNFAVERRASVTAIQTYDGATVRVGVPATPAPSERGKPGPRLRVLVVRRDGAAAPCLTSGHWTWSTAPQTNVTLYCRGNVPRLTPAQVLSILLTA